MTQDSGQIGPFNYNAPSDGPAIPDLYALARKEGISFEMLVNRALVHYHEWRCGMEDEDLPELGDFDGER